MTSEKLMPLNAASGDQFGNSIFIFENYAIIGALQDSTQNQEDPTGCAYIFKKTDGHWNQTCKLLPPPGDQRDLLGTGARGAGRGREGDDCRRLRSARDIRSVQGPVGRTVSSRERLAGGRNFSSGDTFSRRPEL